MDTAAARTQKATITEPDPIGRVKARPVFRNQFGTLYNDDVISPVGTKGRYLRWRSNQEGVVVVPVGPGGYALVPIYRYPVGAASLEFPRGGCETGEDLSSAVSRELREETGLCCEPSTIRPLGIVYADTGIIQSPIRVFSAKVRPQAHGPASPDSMESVAAPVWITSDELPVWLTEGRITCGVTLSAFTLAQSHRVGIE
jgi:8-oxo-dGTP pyrophosphatase MutT (NUDIX family)